MSNERKVCLHLSLIFLNQSIKVEVSLLVYAGEGSNICVYFVKISFANFS